MNPTNPTFDLSDTVDPNDDYTFDPPTLVSRTRTLREEVFDPALETVCSRAKTVRLPPQGDKK